MAIKSKISRVLCVFLTEKFIKPEIIEINKKNHAFYSRETKILGSLYLQYPNEEFWRNLNIGFQINSFAYFKTVEGKADLENKWKNYIFDKSIDKKPKNVIFEDIEISKEGPKKLDMFSWADN